METQLSDHKSNHSIGLLVHENLSIESNIKSVARILTEAWPFQGYWSAVAAILDLRKCHRTKFCTPSGN